MIRIRQIFQFACCAVVMSSCVMSGSRGKPEAVGKEGEVTVVIHRALWDGHFGDSVRSLLAPPVYGLPGSEPMFDLRQQPSLTGFTQRDRHLVIINVDSTLKKTTLSTKNDLYAIDQIVFNLQAPTRDSALACLLQYAPVITDRFLAHDRDSYISYYRNIVSQTNTDAALAKYGVNIVIPREYSLDVNRDNFLWFAREERDMKMGILMWKTPYTSTEQLSEQQMLANINKTMRENVPIRDSTFMATEILVDPEYKTFNKNDVYTVEMKGLWKAENINVSGSKVFMGGPYVCMSIVDQARGQVVTGLGFIFFPRKEKRNYLRMLEAILYTMTPDTKTSAPVTTK